MKKLKALNAKGFAHHIIVPILAVLVLAGMGAYFVSRSNAQTPSGRSATSGPGSNCGSYRNNGEVWNQTYDSNRKNSDSVRNLAVAACRSGMLESKNSRAIAKSGNWSPKLESSIKRFQKAYTELSGNADGKPGPKTICMLGRTYSPIPSARDSKAVKVNYKLIPKNYGEENCKKILN